jgi:transcriptional regulator with XRE-family HTH domain
MAQLETIGQRVAKYRKLEGMSAQKLAEESGLTRSVITNIENGRRDDLTVTELLKISGALRVPPAAIMFDIEKPFGPVVDGEEEGNAWATRNIDMVDWLNAIDTAAEADPDLAEFNEQLESVDKVILYPAGMTVEATYGVAGKRARSLLNAARSLERADVRHEIARRRLSLLAREVWSSKEAQSDQFEDAMASGSVASSMIASELLSTLDDQDRELAMILMRELDAATQNLRDARAQFKLLGGDPMPTYNALSPHQVMNIVRSMPHERLADTEARGKLADGVLENPLRLYRYEEVERLRASRRPTRGDGRHG